MTTALKLLDNIIDPILFHERQLSDEDARINRIITKHDIKAIKAGKRPEKMKKKSVDDCFQCNGKYNAKYNEDKTEAWIRSIIFELSFNEHNSKAKSLSDKLSQTVGDRFTSEEVMEMFTDISRMTASRKFQRLIKKGVSGMSYEGCVVARPTGFYVLSATKDTMNVWTFFDAWDFEREVRNNMKTITGMTPSSQNWNREHKNVFRDFGVGPGFFSTVPAFDTYRFAPFSNKVIALNVPEKKIEEIKHDPEHKTCHKLRFNYVPDVAMDDIPSWKRYLSTSCDPGEGSLNREKAIEEGIRSVCYIMGYNFTRGKGIRHLTFLLGERGNGKTDILHPLLTDSFISNGRTFLTFEDYENPTKNGSKMNKLPNAFGALISEPSENEKISQVCSTNLQAAASSEILSIKAMNQNTQEFPHHQPWVAIGNYMPTKLTGEALVDRMYVAYMDAKIQVKDRDAKLPGLIRDEAQKIVSYCVDLFMSEYIKDAGEAIKNPRYSARALSMKKEVNKDNLALAVEFFVEPCDEKVERKGVEHLTCNISNTALNNFFSRPSNDLIRSATKGSKVTVHTLKSAIRNIGIVMQEERKAGFWDMPGLWSSAKKAGAIGCKFKDVNDQAVMDEFADFCADNNIEIRTYDLLK